MQYMHLPYNPQTDWRQYAAQGGQNLFSGLLQGQKQKQISQMPLGPEQQRFRALLQSKNPQIQEIGIKGLLQSVMEPYAGQLAQGRVGLMKAQTEYYKQGRKPTKDEIKYWVDRGYSTKDAANNAQLTAEISAGLEPRASTRAGYDNMAPTEKMKFLTTLKSAAEGRYFGVEGGYVEPLNPAVQEWTQTELDKLPMFKKQEPSVEEPIKQAEAPKSVSENIKEGQSQMYEYILERTEDPRMQESKAQAFITNLLQGKELPAELKTKIQDAMGKVTYLELMQSDELREYFGQ